MKETLLCGIPLNEVQLRAVNSDSKRILLLSGAGSGKTHTIISRIVRLIHEGVASPEDILALTFSNKASGEMQDRIVRALPEIDCSRIAIKTFHKLGAMLLRRYYDAASVSPDFSIYTPDDSEDLLKSIYPDSTKKALKAPMESIAEAKDRGYDSSTYMDWREAKAEYREYFVKYEEALRKMGNVDFADLICLPVKLLRERPDIRDEVRSRWKYIFVDEYQDTNRMQFELLGEITGDDTNLCVVGDDDQSIYGFRGAEVDHILHFTDTFEDAEVLKLEQNYRSTKSILALANSLIANNRFRHVKKLWTDNDVGEKPFLMRYPSGGSEASMVAGLVERLDDYDDTAIIYRTNAQSYEFETELRAKRIPLRILRGNSFYDKEVVKDTFAYIHFSENTGDVVHFERMVRKPPRGIGDAGVERIKVEALRRGSDVFAAAASLNPPLSQKASAALAELKRCVDRANACLDSDDMKGYFSALLSDSGFEQYCADRDAKDENTAENSHRNAVEELKGLMLSYGSDRSSLDGFMDNIALQTSGDVPDGGVTLATMHAVKGLEFRNVFIVGLEDELVPSQRGDVEEERRLLYVAMTRAKKNLFMSFADRRARAGYWGDATPSRFIAEFGDGLCNSKDFRYGYGGNRAYGSQFNGSGYTYRRKFSDNPAPVRRESPKSRLSPKPAACLIKKSNVRSEFYDIGDRVRNDKSGLSGKVTGVRELGGQTVIDVMFDDGRKASFADSSPLISKTEN